MNQKDKEHVTRFFYRHKNRFNIKNVKQKRYFVQNLLLIQKRLTKLIKIRKK